jgi:hypothetical protein
LYARGVGDGAVHQRGAAVEVRRHRFQGHGYG